MTDSTRRREHLADSGIEPSMPSRWSTLILPLVLMSTACTSTEPPPQREEIAVEPGGDSAPRADADALGKCEPPSPDMELPGFQMPADARWRGLTPLVSTVADVRAALGDPKDVYPSEPAESSLFIYDADGPWDLYIYLVEGDYSMSRDYPAELHERIGSIDLVPEDVGPSFTVVVPPSFSSEEILAADAQWVEFRHPSGLTYAVYGDRSELSNVNRISYRASNCQRTALGLTPAPQQ